MSAIIYQPTKNAMQSGKKNASYWVLVYEPETPRGIYPVMGWTSSRDMKQEIKLRFDTKEQAIAYAEKEGIDYKVRLPQRPNLYIRPYATNFK